MSKRVIDQFIGCFPTLQRVPGYEIQVVTEGHRKGMQPGLGGRGEGEVSQTET